MQRRKPKNTDDSTSLVARVPPSHRRQVESKIESILSMLDRDGPRDHQILTEHINSVDKELQEKHVIDVGKLPPTTPSIDVVVLYSTHISEKVCEYSRHARGKLAWYSQYVCAESHFFPNMTISDNLMDKNKTTNREIDLKIDILSFAMTDAALLLLCESTGYKLVAPFRSDMAFTSLKFKIFCTPAGVAFDPVSEKLFLVEVHVDSMLLAPNGALDSERESFRLKRTDLIYSLEIFGLEHGVLVDLGFDRTSAVRTMRLVYVTRTSAVDAFGKKKDNLCYDEGGERVFTPGEYLKKWGI